MKCQTPTLYPRRSLRTVLLASSLSVALLLGATLVALAHPLGNFTVNHYSRLEVGSDTLNLLYVLDMAEIPTAQERNQIDTDLDGTISQAEQDAYQTQQVAAIKEKLSLFLDGVPAPLETVQSQLEFPPGQANLPILRLTIHFKTALSPSSAPVQVAYKDDNYADRLGWQEIVVRATIGATLLESTVSDQDVSQELTNYPTDLLQSPLRVNQASFRFSTQAGGGSATAARPAGATLGNNAASPIRTTDGFADLIAQADWGPWALLLAVLAAFGWGALHALSPGHGKTIVGAYLVGTRGTVQHALFLGLTTTITHTIGVFIFGLITLFASRYILPELLFPWLSLVSGLLVISIGFSLARSRWRGLWPQPASAPAATDLAHEGGHLLHSHAGGLTHCHALPGEDGPVTWRNLFALGVSGGLLPCPSALVLLLGAIALNRIALGIVLIVIFSVGLASVLTAIGILLIYSRRLFQRIPESGRLFQILPVASAVFITLVGLGITWQALVQTGLLSLG